MSTAASWRPQAASWACFALAAGIVLAMAVFKDARGLDPAVPPMLRVYGSFWASGWAADHGQNPFAVYPLTVPSALPGVFDVNLSPPALLPLFVLLARLDAAASAGPWIIAQAVLFIAGAGILLGTARTEIRPWQAFWMLLVPEIHDSIWLGQDYGLLFLIAVLGWVALRAGHGVTAGLLIGLLVAAKPNLALWPVFLILVGAYRPAFVALACAACLSVLPAWLYGPHVYGRWLAAVAADRHFLFTTDGSVHGFAARLGAPALGSVLSAGIIAAAAAAIWRARPSVMRASALALAVGLVASPLAWADYMVFLLPAFIDDLWGRQRPLAVLLLTVPPLLPLLCMRYGPWGTALGSLVYTGAFLLIAWGALALIRESWPAGQARLT